jgi:GT2 family glycosyltransferase
VTAPACSLIVVNYNGLHHLPACLDSIEAQRYPGELIEVILVDNGSTDGSFEHAGRACPRVRALRNPRNSFAAALNLGVGAARGRYVGFLNNDLTLDPGWLPEMAEALSAEPAAGAVGGKILLPNGRINSVGVEEVDDLFWRDTGFDEVDRGQYEEVRDVRALCWAAVLWRRECLDDVGAVDEDFVMYWEDVDYATRARARNWRLVYRPRALAHHVYRGSSAGTNLTDYFCNRNRFLYLAKHAPRALPHAIRTSHFLLRGERDLLFECMPITIKKLVESHPAATVEDALPALCEVLESVYGARAVDHLLARMQVALGHRRMSLGIYDHALHAIGGGQKYAAALANTLQDEFDITYIANKPVRVSDLEAWYRVDLSRCGLKLVPLPFFERRGVEWIDSAMVTDDLDNPFDAVAEESANYDVFLNSNMLEKVRPLSPLSLFICHFPDMFRQAHFAVDDYSMIINNSEYGREWTRRRWNLQSTAVLYPPVDMEAPPVPTEPLILSVARFEPGGSKKQTELIKAFRRLVADHPRELADWRLVLLGGSLVRNPYLDEVRRAAAAGQGRVEIRVNTSWEEMQAHYARARIFWHACGLQESNPHLIEHFGMTTVEAMQNRCAPIVINGGGQREIIEHGQSGLLFSTLDELCEYTIGLVRDPERLARLQEGAYRRSQQFKPAFFQERVRQLFGLIRDEYATVPLPDPGEVRRRLEATAAGAGGATRHG